MFEIQPTDGYKLAISEKFIFADKSAISDEEVDKWVVVGRFQIQKKTESNVKHYGLNDRKIGLVNFFDDGTIYFSVFVDDATYASLREAVLHRLPVTRLSIRTQGFEYSQGISFFGQVWKEVENKVEGGDEINLAEVIIEDFSMSFGPQ